MRSSEQIGVSLILTNGDGKRSLPLSKYPGKAQVIRTDHKEGFHERYVLGYHRERIPGLVHCS